MNVKKTKSSKKIVLKITMSMTERSMEYPTTKVSKGLIVGVLSSTC